MTSLRRQMIRELELQRKSPKTIEAYLSAVEQLARHYGRSPDKLGIEEVRDFLHHLITRRKLSSSTVNQKVCGIRFFYREVLRQEDFELRVPLKRSGRLPEPLSRAEIARLLDAATHPQHRVLLMTAYSAGLRVGELVKLQVHDIHSQRMRIRVRQGKGRDTLLSPRLLHELREYYHSCRNRHCPGCQTRETRQWVDARAADLLPVPYFHNVFTLPHELNPLILVSERNGRALLKLLFDAAAGTLREFGRTTFDGGKIGFTLVLHTWDQQLRPHFHLHALIASGALSADGSRWIAGGRKFLFPVRGLSKMFRAKFLDGLARLLDSDQLDLPPSCSRLAGPASRRRLLRQWRKTPWVVYSKAPFAGPRRLLDYLGRYTHRVAISNHRLLGCEDGQVRFTWRDRADGDRRKTLSLPADTFLGRFLTHVLPHRFTRVRHYGLLANRGKAQRLETCRRLLGAPPVREEDDQPPTLADWVRQTLGIDLTCCPDCGGPLQCQTLEPGIAAGPAHAGSHGSPEGPRSVSPWDTS